MDNNAIETILMGLESKYTKLEKDNADLREEFASFKAEYEEKIRQQENINRMLKQEVVYAGRIPLYVQPIHQISMDPEWNQRAKDGIVDGYIRDYKNYKTIMEKCPLEFVKQLSNILYYNTKFGNMHILRDLVNYIPYTHPLFQYYCFPDRTFDEWVRFPILTDKRVSIDDEFQHIYRQKFRSSLEMAINQ